LVEWLSGYPCQEWLLGTGFLLPTFADFSFYYMGFFSLAILIVNQVFFVGNLESASCLLEIKRKVGHRVDKIYKEKLAI
jgi:hypothetical protein